MKKVISICIFFAIGISVFALGYRKKIEEERNWLETKYYIEAKKLVTPTEESK